MQKKNTANVSLAKPDSKGLSLVLLNRTIFKAFNLHSCKLNARTRTSAAYSARLSLPSGLGWLFALKKKKANGAAKAKGRLKPVDSIGKRPQAKTFPEKTGLFGIGQMYPTNRVIDPHQGLKSKVLQSAFRRIISDQKKRAFFAKGELVNKLLKTVLTIDSRTASCWSLQRPEARDSIGRAEPSPVGPALVIAAYIDRHFNTPTTGSSRIRNRCILTNKPSVVARFRLGRSCFRRLASEGHIPGLLKAKA
jgi:ribosomal protein S14